MKLRIGIIGCGGIATGKHLLALKDLGDLCEVTAFCDGFAERATAAAQTYGTKDARVYTDYHELLADPNVDVAYVLTPNISHSTIAVDAFHAGKHVMCEKPMAVNTVEAQKMMDAWKASGKHFSIGYQNRFRADVQHLYKSCRSGDLGEIYYAKAYAVRRRGVPTWGSFIQGSQQGGGPLIDIGTHSLDLTLWMMNNYEVESVLGNVHYQLGKQANCANAWGPWDPATYTVEDSAFGLIKMKNGATIILESSWAINLVNTPEATCMLAGSKAGADFSDGLRINGEEYSKLYVKKIEMSGAGVDFFAGTTDNDPAATEAQQWINAILNDTDPTVLPEQALVVSEILEAIYTSAKTGKAVYFD